MNERQQLERDMDRYAQLRDGQYAEFKRAHRPFTRYQHQRLFEKYSDKFNTAYKAWRLLEEDAYIK